MDKHKLIRLFQILLLLILVINSNYFGQSGKPTFEDGVIHLSNLISEQRFSSSEISDINQIDSLYKYAVNYYQGDISEALLALTFATIPFNRMPIKLPIFNVRIPLRLPSVDDNLFSIKRKNLPGIVYFDSPLKGGQDKDKVAHFYGNAFLAYNVSFFNASKFLGMIVEMFESTFKVSGGIDFRDLQTNHLGEFFGHSLRKDTNLKPSDFFNVYSLFYFSYN